MKNKIFGILGVVGLSLLLAGSAAAVDIPGINQTGPTTVSGAVDVIKNVVKWVYIIFFIIAVLFILLAAFTYLTAGGDAEKVKSAHNQIIYAAVAIVVALIAVSVDTIISTFLTSGQ
jgi:heme/copper-type cytochrome/quinol oxidase subunit 2